MQLPRCAAGPWATNGRAPTVCGSSRSTPAMVASACSPITAVAVAASSRCVFRARWAIPAPTPMSSMNAASSAAPPRMPSSSAMTAKTKSLCTAAIRCGAPRPGPAPLIPPALIANAASTVDAPSHNSPWVLPVAHLCGQPVVHRGEHDDADSVGGDHAAECACACCPSDRRQFAADEIVAVKPQRQPCRCEDQHRRREVALGDEQRPRSDRSDDCAHGMAVRHQASRQPTRGGDREPAGRQDHAEFGHAVRLHVERSEAQPLPGRFVGAAGHIDPAGEAAEPSQHCGDETAGAWTLHEPVEATHGGPRSPRGLRTPPAPRTCGPVPVPDRSGPRRPSRCR